MNKSNIVNSLMKEIRNLELDAALINSFSNIYYLSGFTGNNGNLIITQDKKYIVVDGRFTTQAKNECPNFEILEINAQRRLTDIIKKLNIKNLGVEYSNINLLEYNNLIEKTEINKTVDINKWLSEKRAIKSDSEIECVENACKIGDAAFSYILNLISNNVGKITEREIAVEIECFMLKNGANKIAFDTIVASGINSSMPHAVPSNKVIQKNDFVMLDFGCQYNRYCSDMTRTIHIGNINSEKMEYYNLVLEASNVGLKAIQTGIQTSYLDNKVREYFKENNVDRYFLHALGHGVGLEIHEKPAISKTSLDILHKNMIITIEPGIYIQDMYGIRIEETVLIKNNTCKILTKSPKKVLNL